MMRAVDGFEAKSIPQVYSPVLFLGHLDRDLRTVALREPGLVLQSRRHAAVADFVRIAEFVEIEQFGRQRLAAGVSLALVLVDMYFQFSRHCKRSSVIRAWCSRVRVSM